MKEAQVEAAMAAAAAGAGGVDNVAPVPLFHIWKQHMFDEKGRILRSISYLETTYFWRAKQDFAAHFLEISDGQSKTLRLIS